MKKREAPTKGPSIWDYRTAAEKAVWWDAKRVEEGDPRLNEGRLVVLGDCEPGRPLVFVGVWEFRKPWDGRTMLGSAFRVAKLTPDEDSVWRLNHRLPKRYRTRARAQDYVYWVAEKPVGLDA